ncbi:MAG TPA: oligogalacturonate lyase family protein [Bryobacteraceae bacterium]|nr:oligogalacturonate lyase family protein [Bryobacteraceae bacterium]
MERRTFLLTLAAAPLTAQTPRLQTFPGEVRRYQDPTTDLDVFRLSEPAHSNVLPAWYSRPLSRSSAQLVFASDRTGTLQPIRMNLKTGESHQLADAAELDPSSVTFTPDARSCVYFAGRSLVSVNLSTLRTRTLYQIPEGWDRAAGMSVGPDGTHATFAERRGSNSRLRMVSLIQGVPRTVIEGPFAISHPIHRPMRAQILYHRGDNELWMVNADGQQNRALKLAAGRSVGANWTADGKSILYLNHPEDPKQLRAIRDLVPDTGADKLVAKTSQFAAFAFNRDASVFAGASANKGSPTVLILLRVTARERTLCEHKATDPEAVTLFFSPDSQRIYFQSDGEGKPAIYSLHVERLVEKTDDSYEL